MSRWVLPRGHQGLGQLKGVAGTPPWYGECGAGAAPCTWRPHTGWFLDRGPGDTRPDTSGFHSGLSLASWPHCLPLPALPLAYRG